MLARRENKVTQEIADDSRTIAQKTRKDGHQMRSLAVLGTVFLPGTWIAVSRSMCDMMLNIFQSLTAAGYLCQSVVQ
jgi:hypothetical protein